MAVPTNTLQTYQANNNAEDVSNIVQNLSPFLTPFISMVKRGKAEATYTEWPIDSLAAADLTNAQIEGDDLAAGASTTPSRVGNRTQISSKVAQISTTEEAVKKYGYKGAMNYAMLKKGRELKIDMESIMLSNQAPVTGTASVAQKLRPLPSWFTTNVSRGAGGASGTTTAAATDGTQRTITEVLLRGIVVTTATNAAEFPSVLMAGIANRSNVSSQLTGNGTRFYEVKDKTLNATISVYNTDYGPLKIISNRFQRARDLFLLNPDYLEIRYLEPMQQRDLARTGLSDKKMIWSNYTLAVLNEAAHGVLADLNTTAL
jgi:hypothetical protein